MSLRDTYGPLRLLIGAEDYTQLLTDGATWSNVDPGGYEAASFPLPADAPAILRGAPVTVMSGLSTVWQGRVSQPQRSLGHQTLLQCEGYGARFKDLAGSMVFVDRDLTRWQGPTMQRQINVAAIGALQSPEVAADPVNNVPALQFAATGPWTTAVRVDGTYDSGAQNTITKLYANFSVNSRINQTDANWGMTLFGTPDGSSSFALIANLRGAMPVGEYLTLGSPTRMLVGELSYIATGGDSGGAYTWSLEQLATYGNHGLTGRGADPVGFYPSDIFGWVLAQIPDLQPGNIQTTDASNYIIPHYAQYTPVTLDTIINDMGVAQGWHWGVWESQASLTGDPRPRVDFRPRPAAGSSTAFCLRSDCSTVDIREDLSQQYNQCTVTYADVSGAQGAATVAIDNPILDQAGIPTRTLVLDGGTMTQATAAVFAAEVLALTNSQARVAGSVTIISPIDGGARAPWALKAGIDRLRIGDIPSPDAFGAYNDFPIQRVETLLSSSGITVSAELGVGANLVETIQSRLGAATALAGGG